MFAKATLVALVGAVAVSAIDSRAVHSIVSRQGLSESSVPSACQGQCSSALTIYNACLSGDTQTCLSVCESSNYSGFIGCFSCILDNTNGVSDSEVSQLNDAISQLSAACAAAGQTVPATTLTAPAGAGTASGATTGAAVESLTDSLSFTSASGGVTVGAGSAAASGSSGASASSASGASGAAGITSQVGSAAGSATSAVGGAASSGASAVSPSGAAGLTAQLPSFAGLALGVVGVGAGAAFVL